MPYIGRAATNAGSVNYLDDISSGFDGSDVTFTCAVKGTTITPGQENVYIYLDGVFQHPGESYTISGSTITFTEAPVSGVDFTGYVAGEGVYLDDGTVSTAKLDDDAVTASKVDDDGTGFQVGDLGVGGSLTSGDKLTVTGRLRASGGIIGDVTGNLTGNVTGNTSGSAATVTGAAQTAITSVGTLTSLTLGGDLLVPQYIKHVGDTDCHIEFGTDEVKLRTGDSSRLIARNSDVEIYSPLVATSGTFSGQLRVGGAGSGSTENLLVTSATSSDHTRVHIEKTTNAGTAGVSMKSKDSGSWTMYVQDANSGSLYFHDGSENVLTLGTNNLATFAGNVQLSNGQQFQWGGTSNAIFGHHTNNYITMKTSGVDRFTIDSVGGTTMKSGGSGAIAKGIMFQNSGDTNLAAAIFEENTSPTSGELRLYAGGSEKVYLRANSSSSSAFFFKGGQMQDITANNTGMQYRANWDTGFLNRIDNNFDGASAYSSYMRFKIASGAGSQTTALTLHGDGNVTANATFAVTANHSGDWGTELFNASSTGHGTKIRGGSTSSHYAMYVSNHDQTQVVLSCLADGHITAGSIMSSPNFRTGRNTTSVANTTWTQLSGLTNLSPGLYTIHAYIADYQASQWSVHGVVEATGNTTMDGTFQNQSGMELRTNNKDIELWHSAGGTFTIQVSWTKQA